MELLQVLKIGLLELLAKLCLIPQEVSDRAAMQFVASWGGQPAQTEGDAGAASAEDLYTGAEDYADMLHRLVEDELDESMRWAAFDYKVIPFDPTGMVGLPLFDD